MVGSPPAAIVADDNEFFDTRSLARLAAWGLAAAASVAAVLYVAQTELGAQRLATAMASIGTPPGDPQQIAITQLLARTAHAEREARRAIETAQALSADRERLSGKIVALEHDLHELTGSVRQVVASAAEGRSGNKAEPKSEIKVEPKVDIKADIKTDIKADSARNDTRNGAEAKPDARAGFPSVSTSSGLNLMQVRNAASAGWTSSSPVPTTAAAPGPASAVPPAAAQAPETVAAVSAAVPLPRPAPPAAAPAQPPASSHEEIAATAPKQKEATPAATTGANQTGIPKVEFGVDLGPALTVARLRARWVKLAADHPDLVKEMRPVVTVRETGAGKPVEVRLVVGPMANVNGATAFCQALASPQYLCRPAVFDGQRLPMQ